jgi:DNA-binding winged helix-turn-helix (wHTH) protein/Tfp pilus assembly protein PilF
VLDARLQVLCVGDEPLALGPRVVATLEALVERAGEVVTKDEILDRVWAGEDVGESNVAQSVYTLRKVLRDHGVSGAIATVPRRGYRFTASVELLADPLRAPIPVRYERAALPRRHAGRWTLAALALTLLFVAGVPPTPTVAHPPPLSARGAELHRLGRYFWNLRTPSGLAASARLFAEVIAADPRSPLGHAALADANLMFADYDKGHRKNKLKLYYSRARTEIAAALALDRDSAAAHTSLGMLRFAAHHDAAGSDAEFRRALELDPSYAVAHHWYGTTLMQRGRLAEATRELQTAIALEPVAAATGGWLADASYYRGDYSDAIAYARRTLDLDPRRGGTLRRLGLAYELAGDLPHAIAAFERLRRSGPAADEAPALLAEAYARAGRVAVARRALRDAIRLHPHDGDTGFAMLALGDRSGLKILEHHMKKMLNTREAQELQDPRFSQFRNELRQRAQRRKQSA